MSRLFATLCPMRNLARTLSMLSLLSMLSPIVTSIAFAADKPAKKEATFGTGKPTGAYLTKDQLRSCLAQGEKVKANDADLTREQAEITAQKTELARVGDDLKAKLDGIDRTNAEAVAVYNDEVQARDKKIDAYQARVTAFNERVDANHVQHDAFGQTCSNRRYFEEDEAAIRKAK